jgi:hypothetical protein
VDDRGSGWRSDEDRLAQIEDELATLQDDITQLIRILPERLASGQRTPEGVFGRRTGPLESSGPWGRGRTKDIPLRFPSNAIGGVEKQLTTLRWNVDRLLNIVEVPRRPQPEALRAPELGSPPRRDLRAATPRPGRRQGQGELMTKPTAGPVTMIWSRATGPAEQGRMRRGQRRWRTKIRTSASNRRAAGRWCRGPTCRRPGR